MNKRLALSFFRYVASLAGFLLIGLLIFMWWAVGNQLPRESVLEVGQVVGATPPPPPETLTVVSYNIGHGQGVKENAWDYRDQKLTLDQLNQLAQAMKEMDADIFLLQEVDLDSKRTFRVNQIDFLRDRTGHQYYACANVWEKNYLPFPYWPPAHHLGYIKAANCVLSRFPLSNHRRTIFEKPKSNPFWYNLGYIDRGIQRVDVTVGKEVIALLNIHLEAWDIKTREEQIKITYNYMKNLNMPTILGGDFNTIPPDSAMTKGFIDDPNVDYAAENTMRWFFAADPQLKIPELLVTDNSPFELFTFPSDQPNRRLDYIFLLGGNLAFQSFRVVKEAGTASDHLPVMARIRY